MENSSSLKHMALAIRTPIQGPGDYALVLSLKFSGLL